MVIKFNENSVALQDESRFQRFCYELYKLDWVNTHISHERFKQTYMDYVSGCIDSDIVLCPNDEIPMYSFQDYLEEFGFSGDLYACEAEFLESEYLDESYMRNLLEDNELLTNKYEDFVLSKE